MTSDSSKNTRSNGQVVESSLLPSNADLATLAALLREENSDGENADTNLPELLKELDRADGMAREMEDRLDLLLEQLDGMVEGLEASSGLSTDLENSASPDHQSQAVAGGDTTALVESKDK